MKPQDIVVLLKILSLENPKWRMTDIAESLGISPSTVSQALERNRFAGLIDSTKKKVQKSNLLDFLVYGVKYVFPVQPSSLKVGIPTAHSAPPLNKIISSNNEVYVWAANKRNGGTLRGESIAPLHECVINAIKNDEKLYEMLALVDAIRVGKTREYNYAIKELKSRL